MASRRQSGCSWWRIKHYKQSTRAPFDKIARLWSSQFLVEDGFRAHQRKAGLEVVYHISEMPNQGFTQTEDNSILKVKALNYLRWLCRQREEAESFKLWYFENCSNTKESSRTRMSHFAVIFLSQSSIHEKVKNKKMQHSGAQSKADVILSCLSPFVCSCFL